MITALLLLSGCAQGGTNPAEELALQLRTSYLNMTYYDAEANITADYGDQVFTYTLQVEATQSGGTLTVLEPEEVAGVAITWREGETTLIYDGISLETGALSPDGLSPTDCIPLILTALQRGSITEATLEEGEDSSLLVLSLDNPYELSQGSSQITVWADSETYALRRAEIAWEGATVVTAEFV
jgi:outer membrane lipoprotein-sorting protein